MNDKEIKFLYRKIKRELKEENGKLPSNCYFLSKDTILAMPNPYGDARYPQTRDGLNLWAYSSGYITLSETNFIIIPATLEGKEPYLAFYGGIKNKKGKYDFFSISGVSDSEFGKEKVERYIIFNPTSTLYLRVVNHVIFSLEITINKNKEAILKLNALNLSNKEVDVYLSNYVNALLTHSNFESEETKWFRRSTINKDGATLYSVEDITREVHLHNYLVIKRAGTAETHTTSTRMLYVGDKNGQLATSSCLKNGAFDVEKSVSQFIDMAIYGDINKKHLGPQESFSICLKMSYAFDEETTHALEQKTFNEEEVENDFATLRSEFNKEFVKNKDRLIVNFKGLHNAGVNDETFNNFIYQVMKQVDYASKTKNSSVMMLGVRDIAQMLEAMCMWNTKFVKEKLLYVLNYVHEDDLGRLPRQVGSFDKEGLALVDSRHFIDQGQWFITTIYKYLCYTEDFKFLDEKCGYVTHVNNRRVKRSNKTSTVFEHLKNITDYLCSNIDPDTKCLKTLFGDWNDAVDGLGRSSDPEKEFGNGVSIMASFHLYRNLYEFIKIAKVKSLDTSKYEKAREELFEGIKKYGVVSKGNEKRIVHGWGEDRSFYVGSFDDVDHVSRNSSTSNSFYIISEFHKDDPSLIPHVLKSLEYLKSDYGYKTFDVYFDRSNATKVGRIVNLPKGTAENAATYIHAAMFIFKALSMIKEVDLAYEELLRLIPITHKSISTSPFVMPNSYGYNKELGIDGQSMNDWYTGSSNTLLKGLVESFVGIEPLFENKIKISPNKLPIDEVNIELTVKKRRIKYHQISSSNNKTCNIMVNGKPLNSEVLDLDQIAEKTIEIQVNY